MREAADFKVNGRGQWFLQSTRELNMGSDRLAEPQSPSSCSSIPLPHTHRRCGNVQVSVRKKRTHTNSTELGFAGLCHGQQAEADGRGGIKWCAAVWLLATSVLSRVHSGPSTPAHLVKLCIPAAKNFLLLCLSLGQTTGVGAGIRLWAGPSSWLTFLILRLDLTSGCVPSLSLVSR